MQPIPGAGNPFAYASQEQVEEQGNEDPRRMAAGYDPTHELVLVLLKSGTYRVGVLPPGPQKAVVASEVIPGHAREPAAGLKLERPDLETLVEWEAEGGCEAACPTAVG